jgi:heat shock protein HslJ
MQGPPDELDHDDDQALTRADGWQVVSIDAELVGDPPPTLALDPDGTVTGSTGVNRIRGPYELADGTLEVGPLVSTRMAGSTEAMEVEHRFLAVLAEATEVRWDGGTLVLESDAGQLRLEPAEGEIEMTSPLDD